MAVPEPYRRQFHEFVARGTSMEVADVVVEQLPRREADEPATKDFVRAEIAGLDAKLTAQISELDTRLTAQIGGLDAKIGGVDARLSRQMGELDGKIGGLDAKIGGLEAKMERGFRRQTAWIASSMLTVVAIVTAGEIWG